MGSSIDREVLRIELDVERDADQLVVLDLDDVSGLHLQLNEVEELRNQKPAMVAGKHLALVDRHLKRLLQLRIAFAALICEPVAI